MNGIRMLYKWIDYQYNNMSLIKQKRDLGQIQDLAHKGGGEVVIMH